MKNKIIELLNESIEVKKKVVESLPNDIEKAVNMIINCYKNNGKLILFGNGGSAADSQHIAGELVNKFKLERPPLAAIALTTDTSILTSIGNDDGYDYVFEKQVKALCNEDDVVIAITTSDVSEEKGGHSANIANALKAAREKGAKIIGLFSDKTENALKMVDLPIKIPSRDTPRIQESHITIMHIICELVEEELFGEK